MGEAPDVYGAAWRLGNILPDGVSAELDTSSQDVSEQTLTQDLLLLVRELEQQVDQLDTEFDLLLVLPDQSDARIDDLQDQLGRIRRPLVLIKDIAGSGAKFFDYFSSGSAGLRFVERISDPVAAVLLGARETSLSPEANILLRTVVTGAGDLVHRIAGVVAENSEVAEAARKFEKRVETFLAAQATQQTQSVFQDVAEAWCPEMVAIPPGNFLMGSDSTAHQDEKPLHPVSIHYGFAVGRYPVTFEEYDAFCVETKREKPSDNGWGREKRPVINVTWEDAQAYVGWLRQKTGRQYRLLTEAEWEYACRAGGATLYCYGDSEGDLEAYAWFVGHLEGQTSPVGKKLPNDFGLYDMHGNVWEWVEDVWHDNYLGTPPVDGGAWVEGGNPRNRVMRGGSWVSAAKGIRSSVRFAGAMDFQDSRTGMRVAVTIGS